MAETNKFYKLPTLSYGYGDLAPYISEEQLKIHYEKHHQAYVNEANSLLEQLDKARAENAELDMKAVLKSLSFNVGGHILHSLFWENLAPSGKGSKEPVGILSDDLKEEFGSLERFKKEFNQAALKMEGSGWAALALSRETKRTMIMQIEKHNVNIYPGFKILMVLDMFEHAYYLDYKNEKTRYVEAFWNIIDWEKISGRYQHAMTCQLQTK